MVVISINRTASRRADMRAVVQDVESRDIPYSDSVSMVTACSPCAASRLAMAAMWGMAATIFAAARNSPTAHSMQMDGMSGQRPPMTRDSRHGHWFFIPILPHMCAR
ncbi:MAG: hypothetical protein MPK62_02735 [Alphaproteobacteria bacterium]|nr:hypothetical protein [Alphaproteobacteria bacterium]